MATRGRQATPGPPRAGPSTTPAPRGRRSGDHHAVAPAADRRRQDDRSATATTGVESARDQVAASARAGLVRRWVAHDDGRTRADHDAADDQTQPNSQPFTIGDDQLRHPGDTTAPPPGQTVNCRCHLAWRVER
ncbi:hypothetical protein [Kitasatospora sp. NPDC094011]|uniref:hypothetical protein n=1 Tax=Kitasatospora sp. NPDC094011 TaxID=3364090 RepID=UPI00382C3DA7